MTRLGLAPHNRQALLLDIPFILCIMMPWPGRATTGNNSWYCVDGAVTDERPPSMYRRRYVWSHHAI
jgi:hypothetical protein